MHDPKTEKDDHQDGRQDREHIVCQASKAAAWSWLIVIAKATGNAKSVMTTGVSLSGAA